jgi:hypothetical protein
VTRAVYDSERRWSCDLYLWLAVFRRVKWVEMANEFLKRVFEMANEFWHVKKGIDWSKGFSMWACLSASSPLRGRAHFWGRLKFSERGKFVRSTVGRSTVSQRDYVICTHQGFSRE